MKLAEALAERADAMRHYEQLQLRLYRSARVQEGDTPPEDPHELMDEANRVLDRTDMLIRRINKTNASTMFDEKMTITDAIALRDMQLKRRKMYAEVASRAGTTQDRYSRSEIKVVSAVNVRELQREADRLAGTYRKLDTEIQRLNWMIDLL